MTEVGGTRWVHLVRKKSEMTHQTPPFMGMRTDPDEKKTGLKKKVDNHRGDTRYLRLGFEVLSSQLTQRKPGYVELAS